MNNTLKLAQLLSKHQIEIAMCLCDGKTNRQTAEALNISYNTVRKHRSHIFEKLDVHSIQELIKVMLQYGFFPNVDKNHSIE